MLRCIANPPRRVYKGASYLLDCLSVCHFELIAVFTNPSVHMVSFPEEAVARKQEHYNVLNLYS